MRRQREPGLIITGIAIVGQGSMGRMHAAAWAALGLGERIAYVCTPRPGPGLVGAPNARMVTSLKEVLDDEAVDIISVCTPTPTHADIAIRALRAGKNVLLEKPIALTYPDAIAIADVAAASSGMLMVAHVVRFFDGYRALRQEWEAGRLGEVRSVTASRLSSAPGPASWINDPALSGGPLVDFAIHDFDQLNLFLGTPVAVTAVPGRGPGFIETTVEYEAGTGKVVSCTQLPDDHPFSSSLEVTGTRATAAFSYPTATEDSPYATQAAYFLACLRDGVEPRECSIDSAVQALRLSLAARQSLEAGHTVQLAAR
ncbi:MAG TPA: Gfo/Idh/MocA family oxidoreductase [Homoserinimonas sp.]|nr:Gfo/Idh/MocA family oxidoreductase [Homoserinimonas sp.]